MCVLIIDIDSIAPSPPHLSGVIEENDVPVQVFIFSYLLLLYSSQLMIVSLLVGRTTAITLEKYHQLEMDWYMFCLTTAIRSPTVSRTFQH